MTNSRIFLLAIAFIVLWMAGKYLIKRYREKKAPPPATSDDVELWYGKAQERLADMDDELRAEREKEWEGLEREERLAVSDRFMRQRFGESMTDAYTNDEKLTLGRAFYIAGDAET